jgi:hypothetical protein
LKKAQKYQSHNWDTRQTPNSHSTQSHSLSLSLSSRNTFPEGRKKAEALASSLSLSLPPSLSLDVYAQRIYLYIQKHTQTLEGESTGVREIDSVGGGTEFLSRTLSVCIHKCPRYSRQQRIS